jgi:hypothetical protein
MPNHTLPKLTIQRLNPNPVILEPKQRSRLVELITLGCFYFRRNIGYNDIGIQTKEKAPRPAGTLSANR